MNLLVNNIKVDVYNIKVKEGMCPIFSNFVNTSFYTYNRGKQTSS